MVIAVTGATGFVALTMSEIAAGELATVSDTVGRLTGRAPLTLAQL